MVELITQRIASGKSKQEKENLLRETLQLACLKIMQDHNYFTKLAFVGGTALRFLYDMRRFSEDLDFSLISEEGCDFAHLISDIEKGFRLQGLEMQPKTKVDKTVQASILKFPGLLKTMGLSPLPDEKLSIKLEVDTNPPKGWTAENKLINKLYVLNITHLDMSSQYAAKLCACFFRKYTKGRDFYDLIWYLGKRIKPNYELLNNALRQVQAEAPNITEDNIKCFLLERLEKVDFATVHSDVERFLEDKRDLKLLEKETLLQAIPNTPF